MSTFLSILAALLLLSLIVTIHELGHYLVGRWLGFSIVEFSVGMGPCLVRKKVKGISYSLRALPIGGSCMFLGEDEEADGQKEGVCFNAQPAWKRFLVIFAGPFMNVLLALVLSMATLMACGDYAPAILEVSEGPAAEAGMQAGDILISVDGTRVSTVDGAVTAVKAASPDGTVIVVERDGEELPLTIGRMYDEEAGCNRIGVTLSYARVQYGFFRSVKEAFRYVGDIFSEYISFFASAFHGNVSMDDFSGPVGTIAYISTAVRYGVETVLRLAIIINISLAIMNLLPLPALDGGRLVFILIEWIFRRPVPRKVEGVIHFVGIILLLLLMVFFTVHDVGSLIGG